MFLFVFFSACLAGKAGIPDPDYAKATTGRRYVRNEIFAIHLRGGTKSLLGGVDKVDVYGVEWIFTKNNEKYLTGKLLMI